MKYYLVVIITYANGFKDEVSIYSNYSTEDELLQAWYKQMGMYVNATNIGGEEGKNVQTVCVEAKNNVGGIYKHEAWSATASVNVE